MNIGFSTKEKRLQKLDFKKSPLLCGYLLAIAFSYPELWRQFKEFIAWIDLEAKKTKEEK